MKGLDKYRVVAVHSMPAERADDPVAHEQGRAAALGRFMALAHDAALDAVRVVLNGTAHGNTDFVLDAYVIPRSVMAQILKGMA